ncbi:MAG TPA: response regulator [Anaerolineales bacterium]|nr:response regulator [Anaerolineales bacterium]
MTSVPKKIIIVEEQADVADLLEEILSVDGYHVIKIHSSGGALSVIQSENPDVVLLDIMMPDVSGLDVLRFMRREPQLQQIPVVIVSAKTLSSDIRTGLDAGATAYLTKPVDVNKLRETVAEVIRERENSGN